MGRAGRAGVAAGRRKGSADGARMSPSRRSVAGAVIGSLWSRLVSDGQTHNPFYFSYQVSSGRTLLQDAVFAPCGAWSTMLLLLIVSS
jgi:hypothetical protein